VVYSSILWDLEDDPNGNVWHCAEHDVTMEEVEQVLRKPASLEISRSTGRPVAFGSTDSGRFLAVVFEEVDKDTVYPITAYDVSPRSSP